MLVLLRRPQMAAARNLLQLQQLRQQQHLHRCQHILVLQLHPLRSCRASLVTQSLSRILRTSPVSHAGSQHQRRQQQGLLGRQRVHRAAGRHQHLQLQGSLMMMMMMESWCRLLGLCLAQHLNQVPHLLQTRPQLLGWLQALLPARRLRRRVLLPLRLLTLTTTATACLLSVAGAGGSWLRQQPLHQRQQERTTPQTCLKSTKQTLRQQHSRKRRIPCTLTLGSSRSRRAVAGWRPLLLWQPPLALPLATALRRRWLGCRMVAAMRRSKKKRTQRGRSWPLRLRRQM